MMRIKTAHLLRPAVGEQVCGDSISIIRDGPVVTIAVADGLGHGPFAADASESFCRSVEDHRAEPLEQILTAAHTEISRTRGVAAAILRIDEQEGKMEFVGVGNVEVRTLSARRIAPVSIPGIVGFNLRKKILFRYELSDGDLIAVFTDGISGRLELEPFRDLPCEEMTKELLSKYGKNHDDASCVVIRVKGSSGSSAKEQDKR